MYRERTSERLESAVIKSIASEQTSHAGRMPVHQLPAYDMETAA